MSNCRHCGEETAKGYSMCQPCLLNGHTQKDCAVCVQNLEEDLRNQNQSDADKWNEWDKANSLTALPFKWSEADLFKK